MENSNEKFVISGLQRFRMNSTITSLTSEIELGIIETSKNIAKEKDPVALEQLINDMEMLCNLKGIYKIIFEKVENMVSDIKTDDDLIFSNFVSGTLYNVALTIATDVIKSRPELIDKSIEKYREIYDSLTK